MLFAATSTIIFLHKMNVAYRTRNISKFQRTCRNILFVVPILGHGGWRQEGGRNRSGKGGDIDFGSRGASEGGKGEGGKRNFFRSKKFFLLLRRFGAILGWFLRKSPKKSQDRGGRVVQNTSPAGVGGWVGVLGHWSSGGG